MIIFCITVNRQKKEKEKKMNLVLRRQTKMIKSKTTTKEQKFHLKLER